MSSNKDATKIIKKIKVVETDSDNDNDNVKDSNNKSDKVKNLGGRLKKADKYKTERLEILNKLNNILGITEDNNKFLLCDIDNNEDKQKEIIGLVSDIEKYFSCSSWTYFSKGIMGDRKYLSLIRSIYKEFKYDLYIKTILVTRNDKKFKAQQYAVVGN
jgi:hypothetical protein